ncbi:MAG: isoprenylcysteine carboxylmethyltransferase family protein [Desulfarculaceae bacterium]|jgi:protein-S-isoprenylcysteine O-methyltransferase Ste14
MAGWEKYAYLAGTWALWCGLHSLLLWEPLRQRLEKALGFRASVYRLHFSLLALLSLAPVAYYTRQSGGLTGFFWPWPWLGLQAPLWLAGLALFGWALISFQRGGVDLAGWQGAVAGSDRTPHLVTGGAYGLVRHPMHLAALIMIWARHLTTADLIINSVLTAYLFLGGIHEERRLYRMFGAAYQEYARRVPYLVPRLKLGSG